MPITGQGWELHIRRQEEQKRGSKVRTVGVYQVFHDGVPQTNTVAVDGKLVPLSGQTAESKGPGQNVAPATTAKPSRIAAGRYPMKTSGGPTYVTTGFRKDLQITAKMPGLELRKTGGRTDILVHPGKDEFLSSIGCINPCTSLPDANEDISYGGSRRRVIALIQDMKAFLGSVSTAGDTPILNAFVVIDGEPPAPGLAGGGLAGAAAGAAAGGAMAGVAGGSVDGRTLAAQHNVAVKNAAVKIGALHPKMAPVIEAVAKAAKKLGLPQPVITSGNDSSHKQDSLHFKGRALDFRGNNITSTQALKLRSEVMTALGADYDVLFETFANKANNHLHVEFDPD